MIDYHDTLPDYVAGIFENGGGLRQVRQFASPKWSGEGPPPPIGAQVDVAVNGLGRGVVTGYFVQGGWLGCTVDLAEPRKSGGAQTRVHAFGAELATVHEEEQP